MSRWLGFAGVARIAIVAGTRGRDRVARHERAGFASRFVKPGEPSATYDDPTVPAQKSTLSEYVRKLRALQSKATAKSSSPADD